MKSSILNFWRCLPAAWMDLCAPDCCLLCQKVLSPATAHGSALCSSCYNALDPAPDPEVLLNDILHHFPDDRFCISRAYARFSAGRNDRGGILDIIHALKYQGFTRMGEEMGRELGSLITFQGHESYESILPVPIHSARGRERGYNQAEAIAKGISEVLQIPLDTTLLCRQRYTTTQTRLSNSARQSNVANAFGIGKGRHTRTNAQYLLVDDVLTTGSTLNHLALVLLEHGARRVDVATLVRAE